MARRTGPTDINTRKLISFLEKQKSKFWKRTAKDLKKPTRIRREVNISRIQRYAKEGETIVVPGKVLGVGELKKQVTIAATSFSGEAKKKIKASGSTTLTIKDLVKKKPEGKGVVLLG